MYPNSDFHHLHVHTEFSVLDGLAKVSKLVNYAKKLGFRSLAITDHGSMQGVVKFYNACMEEDEEKGLPKIKPIIGTETYLCDNIEDKSGGMRGLRHIILIAKNYVGYQNLMKLSTRSYREGFYYKSRIDFKMLEEHAEGLICSTACIDGYIPQLLLQERYDEASANTAKMKDIFGDDFYLEVMYHGMDMEATVIKHMLTLSEKHDVKIIATNDVHYGKKEHAQAQEVLMAIEMRKSMRDPSRYHLPTPDFYLKTAEEMAEIFCPEMEYALQNTNEIYEKIDLKIKPDEENVPMLLPEIEMPPEFSDEHEYLIQLAKEGLAEYGKQTDSEYVQRLDYELDGIKQTGFSRYFIMVWDYVNFCREKNIRIGAGRGSGCGSLVLFCLKITKLDPLKFDLLFERFLNTERISWPDIDIDFAHTRRPEVFEYIINKYGRERTGKIGTNQTFKARGAVRFCVKHLDPCDDFGTGEKRSMILSDEIAKSVPFDPKIKLKEAYDQSAELKAFKAQYPRIFEIAETVEGVSTRPSVHAAGIVAAPGNIEDFVPMHTTSGGAGKEREICTQYAMEDLEEIGLVKFDVLGLNTLTVIDRCLDLIRDKYFDIKIDIDDLPFDDPGTLKLFREGKTDCVFQMESYGMKKLLQDMEVDSIEDVIAANALYRPGALQAEAHIKYADCKNGRQSIEKIQEEVDEVLAPTYGQIVYQEQVMHISKIVAGFTGGQADSLRKAIGKKKGKIFKELKTEFFEGSDKLKKITREQAEDIWQKFEFFGGYAFNKSVHEDTLIPTVNGEIKKICEFKEGDKVWCFDGNKKVPTNVVELHDHGFLNMFEVEFDDGAKVKCSINHKFLTPHGMQPLHAILEHKLGVYSNAEEKNKWMDLCGMSAEVFNQTGNAGSSEREELRSESACEFQRSEVQGLFGRVSHQEGINGSQASMRGSNKAELQKPQEKCIKEFKENKFSSYNGREEKETKKDGRECVCRSGSSENSLEYNDTIKQKQEISKDCSRESFCDCIKNISETRHSEEESSCSCQMANRKSRSILGNSRESSQGTSEVEGRNLAERECPKGNEIQTQFQSEVRRKAETSGFCEERFLDRGGWLLAFWSRIYSALKARFPKSSPERCDAQSGSGKTGSNISQTGAGMLVGKWAKKIKTRMAGFSNNINEESEAGCVSLREVVSVRPVGEGHVYDLEVTHPTHNFILANGLVTSNSHSAAYGVIAYQTAYLKCHYPIEFMVATLTVEAMDQKQDKVEEYIKVCQRAGLEVLPLDVNKSKTVFAEEDGKIRSSLISIKGVGSKAADNISETQPYNDLEDFCMKTDGSVLNTAVVGALADAGAFSAFGKKKDIILAYPEVRAMAENKKADTTKRMFDVTSESKDLKEYVKKAKVKNSQQKIQKKKKKSEKKSMF